jgi:hypothetical protein
MGINKKTTTKPNVKQESPMKEPIGSKDESFDAGVSSGLMTGFKGMFRRLILDAKEQK